METDSFLQALRHFICRRGPIRELSRDQGSNLVGAGVALQEMDDEKIKVARYSFSGPIPPKFEHKLRRHKQSFVKIATTVVLDKDENLL